MNLVVRHSVQGSMRNCRIVHWWGPHYLDFKIPTVDNISQWKVVS